MINLDHVHKVVDGVTVLEIERLRVDAGEIAAVIGAPGSGLDVLFELLIGRSRPAAGTVRLGEVDPIADRAAFSTAVGVMFSDDALYRHRSARGHLAFDCRLRGLPRQRVDAVLADVGLADCAGIHAEKLPAALQRRLAFGRAIVHAPSVLLLAEPFARCDDATVDLLARQIRARAAAPAAVLILAHDTTRLTHVCSVLHILEHGRIVETRRPGADTTPTLPLKIPVRLEDEVVLVNPADILFAAAQEGRALLRTIDRELATQFTLNELEERLAGRGFFRAHRSYLVNLQHVKSVIPYTRATYSLILDDPAGTEIPLSRNAATELRQLLGY